MACDQMGYVSCCLSVKICAVVIEIISNVLKQKKKSRGKIKQSDLITVA